MMERRLLCVCEAGDWVKVTKVNGDTAEFIVHERRRVTVDADTLYATVNGGIRLDLRHKHDKAAAVKADKRAFDRYAKPVARVIFALLAFYGLYVVCTFHPGKVEKACEDCPSLS